MTRGMVLVMVLLCLVSVTDGCGERRVTVAISQQGDTTIMKLTKHHVNYISDIYLWDAVRGNHIWILHDYLPATADLGTVTFGVPPRGEGVLQYYPVPPDKPKAPKPGDIVGVHVDFSYDEWLHPMAASSVCFFEVQKDGQWLQIRDSPKISQRDRLYLDDAARKAAERVYDEKDTLDLHRASKPLGTDT